MTCIILVGPYNIEYTPIVVREFLRRNDSSIQVIVVSSMENPTISLSPYEVSLIREEFIYSSRVHYLSSKGQDLTVRVGLEYSQTLGCQNALVCRKDIFLGVRDPWKLLLNRGIVICEKTRHEPPLWIFGPIHSLLEYYSFSLKGSRNIELGDSLQLQMVWPSRLHNLVTYYIRGQPYLEEVECISREIEDLDIWL